MKIKTLVSFIEIPYITCGMTYPIYYLTIKLIEKYIVKFNYHKIYVVKLHSFLFLIDMKIFQKVSFVY